MWQIANWALGARLSAVNTKPLALGYLGVNTGLSATRLSAPCARLLGSRLLSSRPPALGYSASFRNVI